MAKTVNKTQRDRIIDRFINNANDGTPGSLKTYKFLQDMLLRYIQLGGLELNTEEMTAEFTYRFAVVSDTIHNLEALAEETINKIKAAATEPNDKQYFPEKEVSGLFQQTASLFIRPF